MKLVYIVGFVISILGSNTLNSQVNLQTGSSETNIPLFNFNDNNSRLNGMVSLAYTAGSGLRVNDIGESVGAGWTLDYGGAIVRIQHGEPDDQKQEGTFNYPYSYTGNAGDYFNYVFNYYPNGYLYSEYNPSQSVDNRAAFLPIFERPGLEYKQSPAYIADREQDVFSFSFNGRSGSFLIGKNGVIRTLEDSKLKIDKVVSDMSSSNIITRISEFIIVDEMGIKYIFKDLELNEKVTYKALSTIGALGTYYVVTTGPTETSTILKGEATNKFIVGKWYLSEVVNPLINKKIIYSYDTYNVDMVGNKLGFVGVSDTRTSNNLTVERIKGVAKKIKRIEFSNKEKVEFVYSLGYRKDLTFDKALEEINIKYDNEIKKKWRFEYGYFVDGNIKEVNSSFTQDEQYKSRMCLLSLSKTDNTGLTTEPPVKFEYFIGNILTDFGGFTDFWNYEVSPLNSFYQDNWGYSMYKAFGFDNAYLSQPRNDINYSNFNWGSFKNFTKNEPVVGENPPGIRSQNNFNSLSGTLRKITYSYGGSLNFEYERNVSKVFGTSQEVKVGGYRVIRTTLFDGNNQNNNIIKEYKYITNNGSSSGWGYEPFVYQNTRINRIYRCDNNSAVPIILQSSASSFLTAFAKEFSTSPLPFKLNLKTSLGVGAEAGLQAGIQALALYIVTQIFFDLFSTDYHDYTILEYSTFSNSSGNSLPSLYSRVEVVEKLLSENIGKTVVEFTSDQDYPIDVQTLTVPNSNRPRYTFWAYGLPKSVTVYNKVGDVVKKSENQYQVIKYMPTDNNFTSQKWISNKTTFACTLFPANTGSTSDINSDIYNPIFGRTILLQSKEYAYNSNNEYTLSTTDYEYNPVNYLVNKVKSTNSKGELIETCTYYPNDYSIAGAIDLLQINNIISNPVSSQTFVTKTGNQKYLLNGSVSEFGVLSNGDIKVSKTHSFRSSEPIISTLVPFNSSQLIPNTNYYKETGSVMYDASSNPVQINSDNGKVSSIYDYDNKLPVATVINATTDDIAYTSFETESLGGWSMNIGSTYVTDKSITGKRSLSGSLNKTLIHPGNYTVTLWCHSSSAVSVNSQSGNLLSTNGDWKLYEWKLNGVSSIQITGGIIDEVRLYPSIAKMSTVTYDPMIGKTSECDLGNRITYYEYDGLGRLKIVGDENKNVIKTYEYNYKQQ